MVEPNLWKTSKRYILHGSFVVDLLSTLGCDIILLANYKGVWFFRLKMLVVLKTGEIKSAYIFFINNYVHTNSHTKQMFKTLANITLISFLSVHLMTCIWIAIGAGDCHLDNW